MTMIKLAAAVGVVALLTAAEAPAEPIVAPGATVAVAAAPSDRPLVVLVITPELRKTVWTHGTLDRQIGMMGSMNDLGAHIADHAKAALEELGLQVMVVDAAGKIDGARFYVTPTIKRHEETFGLTAFSKNHQIVAVEWKVEDAKGQILLQDTALAESQRRAGNMFTNGHNVQVLDQQLMDDLFAKTRALLQPVVKVSARSPAGLTPSV